MMQAASLIGVYGLTFVAPLVAATPALIWPADDRSLTARLGPFFFALVVLAAQIGFGAWRLQSTEIETRDDMRVRLVQPDIDEVRRMAGRAPAISSRPADRRSRSRRPGPNDPGLIGVTHLIWPESAFPFYLSKYPEALARIARTLPPGTLLITGGAARGLRDRRGGGTRTGYNSILAINSDGEIVASYDKTHLVPFGEYLPFGELFAQFGITQFVPGTEAGRPASRAG